MAWCDIDYFTDLELIHKSEEFTSIFGNATSINSQSVMNHFFINMLDMPGIQHQIWAEQRTRSRNVLTKCQVPPVTLSFKISSAGIQDTLGGAPLSMLSSLRHLSNKTSHFHENTCLFSLENCSPETSFSTLTSPPSQIMFLPHSHQLLLPLVSLILHPLPHSMLNES